MSTYKELYLSLMSRIKPLPLGEARNAVQSAYRDALDFVTWSFLIGQGFIEIPDQVSVTATVISGATVTINQATNALLLASQSVKRLVPGRQFRVNSGFLYTIEDYTPGTLSLGVPTGTGTLTLDRDYWDDTPAPCTASVYLAYPVAPVTPTGSTDFVAFMSIVSRQRVWAIRMLPSRIDLDMTDPRRVYFGPVQALVPFDTTAAGVPRYEFVPHPQAADQLICYYRRRGPDFTNDDDLLPPPITPEVIRSRALYYAYEWAESNKGAEPNLQKTNWAMLMAKADKDYQTEVRKCNLIDRDSHLRRSMMQPRGTSFHNFTVNWNGASVSFPIPNW